MKQKFRKEQRFEEDTLRKKFGSTRKAKSPGSTQNRSILDRIEGYGSDSGEEVPESANFQLDRPESNWIDWIKQGSTDSKLIQTDPGKILHVNKEVPPI
ncbi:hypothetical protein Taro_054919 [Colocasia esculenta]|uniref:Uncharacterized protein n=1 Tax=Colocasia esculenta TaxID=4460 RepID=A0A843XPZ0_COLES|nr:hypothetical protein [Colocasia esculenta]